MTGKLLSALLATVTLFGLPAAANAATKLQPGAYHETSVGACTLNFVYDGGGKTYLGTAAHCVKSVGQAVRDENGDVFGRVALVGNEDSAKGDYALIKVDAEDVDRVSPRVKGIPNAPTGVTRPKQTAAGDLIGLSGYGLGFGATQPTREWRSGVLGFDDADEYTLTAPLIYGDSGGPLVHLASGRALGIVSRLCLGVCTDEGPTVQGILSKAAARGLSLKLRTV